MLVYKLPNAAAAVLTISTTAVSVADAITAAAGTAFVLPCDTDAVTLFIEANSIRWLDDGNTPTASLGHLASATGRNTLTLTGSNITKFRMIREGASDATVTVRVGTATKR